MTSDRNHQHGVSATLSLTECFLSFTPFSVNSRFPEDQTQTNPSCTTIHGMIKVTELTQFLTFGILCERYLKFLTRS